MRMITSLAAISLAVVSFVLPARGDDSKCKKVNGHALWTLIPAPNDPFGRILGPATGDLKASISAIITDIKPGDTPGQLAVTSLEVWVLGAQDMFIAAGSAKFT